MPVIYTLIIEHFYLQHNRSPMTKVTVKGMTSLAWPVWQTRDQSGRPVTWWLISNGQPSLEICPSERLPLFKLDGKTIVLEIVRSYGKN